MIATVTISLEAFEDLKRSNEQLIDFKNGIKEGMIPYSYTSALYKSETPLELYTKDKVVGELVYDIKALNTKFIEMENTLTKINDMTLFQLIKWWWKK